jgi:hypothetical protein
VAGHGGLTSMRLLGLDGKVGGRAEHAGIS